MHAADEDALPLSSNAAATSARLPERALVVTLALVVERGLEALLKLLDGDGLVGTDGPVVEFTDDDSEAGTVVAVELVAAVVVRVLVLVEALVLVAAVLR